MQKPIDSLVNRLYLSQGPRIQDSLSILRGKGCSPENTQPSSRNGDYQSESAPWARLGHISLLASVSVFPNQCLDAPPPLRPKSPPLLMCGLVVPVIVLLIGHMSVIVCPQAPIHKIGAGSARTSVEW